MSALLPGTRGDAEYDVIGLGQNAFDLVCEVDGLPAFASKARIHRAYQRPGGQVATAVLACARLGLRARYLGKVGDDPAADAALAPLAEAGVDVTHVQRVEGAPTQMAVILVDRKSGERTVLWHRDAALAPQAKDFEPGLIASARILHLDGSDPESGIWAAQLARRAGTAIVLDADAPMPGIERLLPLVDFPIVSREFAETYFGTRSIRAAVARLAAGGARLAAVTLGEWGVLAQVGERLLPSPAFRVEARDTTGAGDAFHGGFIWSLLAGHDAERALRTANAVAAMNCRASGAQGGLPDAAALRQFEAEARPGPWRDPDRAGS